MSLEIPFVFAAFKLLAMMARVGAFVFSFPHFMDDNFPMMYKNYLIVVICVVLYPVVPDSWGAGLVGMDLVGLTYVLTMEAAVGLLLSIIVYLYLMVFQIVGFQIGNSLGLGMGQSIDPVTGNNESGVITSVFIQLFMVSLLVVDFHYDFIALAAESFKRLGPGELAMDPQVADNLISLGSHAMLLGFKISLPIFAMELIVNVALGFLTRVGQDFPVLLLSFPIKTMLSFMIMSAMIPAVIYFCRVAAEEMLQWSAYVLF